MRDPALRDIPVIATTATCIELGSGRAAELGDVGWLPKPFRPEVLPRRYPKRFRGRLEIHRAATEEAGPVWCRNSIDGSHRGIGDLSIGRRLDDGGAGGVLSTDD
jgi:CheY-like chemotaxis protein